jgi:hypothetical protein
MFSFYKHRNQLLVLDDVDGLYADRSGIRLLKALCQTEPRKTLSWHTATPILQRRSVPPQFTTYSAPSILWPSSFLLSYRVALARARHYNPQSDSVLECRNSSPR